MDKKNIIAILELLESSDIDDKIEASNVLKMIIKAQTPFNDPVSTVIWVRADKVIGNDYNPNTVAPPEMELLTLSILENGYTQPIVVWRNADNMYEVVDGFHRHRVGKENKEINERLHGYLPVVIINDESTDRGERIASTIRHNRARGKHTIDGMAEIILELKRRNWSDKKIGKNLGMDPDEVLRLSQITGLAEMFKDREFSKAWEPNMIDMEDNLDEVSDGTNISQS